MYRRFAYFCNTASITLITTEWLLKLCENISNYWFNLRVNLFSHETKNSGKLTKLHSSRRLPRLPRSLFRSVMQTPLRMVRDSSSKTFLADTQVPKNHSYIWDWSLVDDIDSFEMKLLRFWLHSWNVINLLLPKGSNHSFAWSTRAREVPLFAQL